MKSLLMQVFKLYPEIFFIFDLFYIHEFKGSFLTKTSCHMTF